MVDEVPSTKFTAWNHSIQNIEQLQAESEKRLATDEMFATVDAYHQYVQEYKKNTNKSLSLTTFRADQADYQEKLKVYKDRSSIEGFDITSLKANQEAVTADSLLQKKTDNFHKKLKKDFYLHEALQIINSLQTDSGAMNEE